MTAPPSDPSSRRPSLARPAAWVALAAPLVAAGVVALAREGTLGRDRSHVLAGIHVSLLLFGIMAGIAALVAWRRRPEKGVVMPAVVGLLLSAITLAAVAYALLRPGRPAPIAPAQWRPYASAEGRFFVLLPATPT